MSLIEKSSMIQGGVPQNEFESEAKIINPDLVLNESQVEENQNQIIRKYLFTGGKSGHLMQWDIEQQKLMKDYGRIHQSMI